VVEGAPLLRAYMGKTRIEGSNPSLSARTKKAFVEGLFLCAEAVSKLPAAGGTIQQRHRRRLRRRVRF
jgi:hypothetical protein